MTEDPTRRRGTRRGSEVMTDALQLVLEKVDAPPELFDILLKIKLKTLGTMSFLGESGTEAATKVQRIADANGHGALPKARWLLLALSTRISLPPGGCVRYICADMFREISVQCRHA